jgi:hypothetical protein
MEQNQEAEAQIVREVGMPLFLGRGWLKFLGIISIIEGILTIFSVVGILICWIPIWLGVLLMRSAGDVELAQVSGNRLALTQGLQRLKTYFVINGVLQLILILGFVIAIFGFGLLAIIAGSLGWSSGR